MGQDKMGRKEASGEEEKEKAISWSHFTEESHPKPLNLANFHCSAVSEIICMLQGSIALAICTELVDYYDPE